MKKICYLLLILSFSMAGCAPTEAVIEDNTQAGTTDSYSGSVVKTKI